MALVKCKECGEEVSNKAKACPKCGAKVPKKTSLFTWLVLIFIIFIVYSVSTAPTHSPTRSSSPAASNTSAKAPVVRTPPTWTTSSSKDEMTSKTMWFASSPSVTSTKPMTFPYAGVTAWMGVGCKKGSEWVYIGFSKAPNLNDTEIQEGYNLIKTRMRWDDKVETATLTQDWGKKFLHFVHDKDALSKIATSKTAKLELNWHGQQSTYFEFSLNGSSKAVSEIRAKCGN